MVKEEFTEKVNLAMEAANASTAEGEYKLAAFKITLHTLLGQAEGSATPPAGNAHQGVEADGEWQERIAKKLQLSNEDVAAIYHKESDESLRLMLDSGILPKNQQTATQDIAILLAAGRVAGGFDESAASTEIIRAETEYYGRLDKNNFSRALRSLKPNFHYDSKDKTLSPRAPGFADAAVVVKKYLGEKVK